MVANRSLLTAMAITAVFGAGLGAQYYLLTVYLQDVLGYDPLRTGLVYLPLTLLNIVGTKVAERLVTGVGMRAALSAGLVIGAVGMVLLAVAVSPDSAFVVVLPGIMVTGFGMGIVWTSMWIAVGNGVGADGAGGRHCADGARRQRRDREPGRRRPAAGTHRRARDGVLHGRCCDSRRGAHRRRRPWTPSGPPRRDLRGAGGLDFVACEDGVGVHDAVRVALFGEETLAVGGVVLVEGVAGDDGVEAGAMAGRLRTQKASEPLGLFLPGPVGARHLDGDGRLRQVDGEVRDLRHHQHADFARAEGVEKAFPFADAGLALDDGCVQ
ncbi:MFS transporter [Actinomadura sp. KC06]|nr:MFS transporter [Actinomadura sp. KC06]